MQVRQLNPYYLPLYGQKLIEASAGTGKTYTIIVLYLRLLLGIRQKNIFSKRLSVKEILVVTFTELATNELRSRIRDNIHQMRMACIRNGIGFNKKSKFHVLLSFITDRYEAAQLLLVAERQMDEAAIYTIHSFCQYILIHNAFESGTLFNQSVIKNEHALQYQACADFWRSNCYPLNYYVSKIIVNEWNDPEELLAEVKPYLQGDMPIFVNQPIKSQSIEQYHEILINTIKTVKKLWLANSIKICELIIDSDINRRIYSNFNLSIWLSKINNWAQSDTIDYKIPKELNRFSKLEIINKTTIGKVPNHEVFTAIDDLLQQSLTLRDLVISKAIISIRQIIIQEKKRRREIGFDDLLSNLDLALQSKDGEKLSDLIRKKYPVVMIDEFQDTDPQQYRIFQRIYNNYNYCSFLLFIGDPKQAIYAFRGADIFTYLKAKDKIKSQYTINTNWRSSSNMIAAVNQLFSLATKPFLFEQISFNIVEPANHNQDLTFTYKTEKLSALNFYYLDKNNVSIVEYQKIMAYQCANQICKWLKGGENGTSWLCKNSIKYPVTASDIVVLVRSRHEAIIIKEELSKFNISSVFLSNKESVFSTNEAKELLWIIQAVLFPENESILRCALATKLIGLSAQDIEQLNQDENQLEIRIKEFTNYLLIWRKSGILSALRTIMVNYQIAENLIMDNIEGKRCLINIMHLSELLQEADLQFDDDHYALIRWLAKQIERPDSSLDSQQIRLENNNHLVKISTIHKSKGLEFPIVWLPFGCQFSSQKLIVFHDRNKFQTCVDLTKQKESIKLSNEEHLSEDLRLLYVALTRAKYHCSVGVAPLIKNSSSKRSSSTDLHQTALGYLLQDGQLGDATMLRNALNMLASKNISVTPVSNVNSSPWYPKENKQINLVARNFTGHIQNNWRVTSYSELSSNNTDYSLEFDKSIVDDIRIEIDIQDLISNININQQNERSLIQDEIVDINKSIHDFPNGTTAGIFLHSLLELLPFNQHPSEFWLIEKLKQSGFSENWASILKSWLIDIFNIPLVNNSFSLSNIIHKNQSNEMRFYLSIGKLLTSIDLNKLICRYDALSRHCLPLTFKPITGILTGCIDLVFCYKNKFYLVDYKSNWLGKNSLAYSKKALEKSMIDHRYDLQYQFYTLALHRYLRNHLVGYNYQKDFGGVIYFFLRGVDINNPDNGIYYTIPSYELINSLDKLFSVVNLGKNDDSIIKTSC